MGQIGDTTYENDKTKSKNKNQIKQRIQISFIPFLIEISALNQN